MREVVALVLALLLLLLAGACEKQVTHREIAPVPADEPLVVKNDSSLERLFQQDASANSVAAKESLLKRLYDERLRVLRELNSIYYGPLLNASISQAEKNMLYRRMDELRKKKEEYTSEIVQLEQEVSLLKAKEEREERLRSLREEEVELEEALASSRKTLLAIGKDIVDLQKQVAKTSDPQEAAYLAEQIAQLRTQEVKELEELQSTLQLLEKTRSDIARWENQEEGIS
ncbi:hypothetical protein D6783_04715 [Candidatus Woesearchaeota archaeon]|nr:MAG: hypothetical protein D6783_04715 [Candidatus Woesearchaeota archaeon]